MNALIPTRAAIAALIGMLLVAASVPAADSGGLTENDEKDLAAAKYAYIQSTRKDGSLSKPAEIWFMHHEDAIWVGTTPQSWRAKRIKAGRPRARISIGKPDNTPFFANGEIVKDEKVEELMMKSYAEKYPDRWPGYAERFRNGFKDGSRIVIKYVPEK